MLYVPHNWLFVHFLNFADFDSKNIFFCAIHLFFFYLIMTGVKLYSGWFYCYCYHSLDKFSRWQTDDNFQKTGFDILCKVPRRHFAWNVKSCFERNNSWCSLLKCYTACYVFPKKQDDISCKLPPNFHEMSNSIFREICEKYFKMSSGEIFTKHAMC